MTELKCPICNSNLIITRLCDGVFPNPNKGKIDEIFCDKCKIHGTEKLWQALIDTKELLDIESAEHSMCHTQMLKTTEKLEHTKKKLDDLQKDYDLAIQHAKTMTETCLEYKAKLDIAVDALMHLGNDAYDIDEHIFIENTLKQIKDNDKDVK